LSPERIADAKLTALRRAAGNVLLLVLSVLSFFLVLELAMRLVALWVPPIMALDARLGWVHQSNIVRKYSTENIRSVCRTNALGLRGVLPLSAPPRTRLLILGDSYADGLEVSDTDLFSELWADMRPDLAIFNAGVGGYSNVQELELFGRLKDEILPDFVVLMVSWNDLDDNLLPFYATIGPRPYADRAGNLHPVDWSCFRPFLLPFPGSLWLHQHSLASYAAQSRYLGLRAVKRNRALTDRYSHSVSDEKKWEILAKVTGRLAAQIPLVIVGVPSRELLVEGKREFSDNLARISRHLGAQWVDLQAVLKVEDYYAHDIHWNASGHRHVAEHLASVVGPQTPSQRKAGAPCL
jgi:hypothetical protein